MAKGKVGTGACDNPDCGEGVVWKESESGSLSYTCQHCDFRAYAPAHTDAARAVRKRLGLAKVADAELDVASKPEDPAPPPKKRRTTWEIAMGVAE